MRKVFEFPEIGEEVYPGIRRLLVPVFKYRVYYLLENDMATVLAVHHPSSKIPDQDELT